MEGCTPREVPPSGYKMEKVSVLQEDLGKDEDPPGEGLILHSALPMAILPHFFTLLDHMALHFL